MVTAVAKPQKFLNVNSGGQVLLDDGSCWRVGLNFGAMVARWNAGDQIIVGESGDAIWRIRLTNLETDEYANALPSSKAI